jgi:hypothetical protein
MIRKTHKDFLVGILKSNAPSSAQILSNNN